MRGRIEKALLSVVTGNTAAARGRMVDCLLGASGDAVVFSVTVHGDGAGYPVVQRFVSRACGVLGGPAPRGASGDPTVILRQDLLRIRRELGARQVILALPENLELLPLLAGLFRSRPGATALGNHYAPAPVLVGVDPATFIADLRCAHRATLPWGGGGPVTVAEQAARQVEAADVLLVSPESGASPEMAGGVAALVRHVAASHAAVFPRDEAGVPAALLRPLPPGAGLEWSARLEPVTALPARRGTDGGVRSVLWRSRRPLHPGRLADALPLVMKGVLRSRGHLWLSSRPGSVVTWRSAGSHLELREADGWLEHDDAPPWASVSPLRRTLASWFWHEAYGERRNELVFTGVDLDADRLRAALDDALLLDEELALGPDGWADIPDPLLSDGDRL